VVTAVGADTVSTASAYTGQAGQLATDAVVLVTARLPEENLLTDLTNRADQWVESGMLSVRAIGDAYAPATIAAAVYEGHKYAEELDTEPRTGDTVPFRREVTALVDEERKA
jgi:dimethylamine/trimethylamine dehydrogenase